MPAHSQTPKPASDHPFCHGSWFLSLAFQADELLVHNISPHKLELTACSSTRLFPTGNTVKTNGLLAASLFYFGIATPPALLI